MSYSDQQYYQNMLKQKVDFTAELSINPNAGKPLVCVLLPPPFTHSNDFKVSLQPIYGLEPERVEKDYKHLMYGVLESIGFSMYANTEEDFEYKKQLAYNVLVNLKSELMRSPIGNFSSTVCNDGYLFLAEIKIYKNIIKEKARSFKNIVVKNNKIKISSTEISSEKFFLSKIGVIKDGTFDLEFIIEHIKDLTDPLIYTETIEEEMRFYDGLIDCLSMLDDGMSKGEYVNSKHVDFNCGTVEATVYLNVS